MKLSHRQRLCQPSDWASATNAFTITEMMVTVAIFSLVVVAMVSLQIFGFRMNALTSSKLKSTADCLKALDQIRNQILGATEAVLVGNFNTTNSTFSPIANSQLAIGNAVLISNSPVSLATFYVNPATGIFYEFGNATNSQPQALAHSLVNPQPFQAEDCFGRIVRVGSSDHYTVKMTLQFSNLVYSIPTPTYETYRLESRATPRRQFDHN